MNSYKEKISLMSSKNALKMMPLRFDILNIHLENLNFDYGKFNVIIYTVLITYYLFVHLQRFMCCSALYDHSFRT